METSTYLTQIAMGKENEGAVQPKFIRHNIGQPKTSNIESEQLKKTKSSNQALMKDANTFLPDEYYAIKKVKPRIHFYRTILEIEERRKTEPDLPLLRINMPESLVLLEHSLELIYSEKGVVKVKSEQCFNQFVGIVKPVCKKDSGNQDKQESMEQEEIEAAVLMGVGNCSYTDFSIALSNELDSRIIPKSENQVSIKFIQPFNNHPNTLRLFYKPKTTKNSKPNHAYKAMNKKKLSDQILQRKYKQIHHYLVDFSKDDQIVTTLVRGKALAEVEIMTQSIVQYLEAAKKVRISQIVVDYCFGADRMYYFHEIKSIKSVNLDNIWDIGTTEQKQQKYKQQTNQIYCRLCTFQFPKPSITKHVTNKLIAQLLLHLQNRNVRPFGNFTIKQKQNNLSGLSNVCDLCYELIVAENRLINVEREFRGIVNLKVEELVGGCGGRLGAGVIGSQELQVYQWRIFVYLERVKNVNLGDYDGDWNFNLNMKFSDFKQTFVKQLEGHQIFDFSRARSSTPSRKLHPPSATPSLSRLSRHQKKSTLHTNFTNRSHINFQKSTNLDFQKIKLMTFYTKSQDISQILMNQQLIFQLSFGNRKYKGQSSTLQNFTNKKSCQRHSCQVLLFGSEYQYCNLELNVGLICDGPVSTSSLSLLKSSKQNLYYSRDSSLRNCTPLPAEWIETISQGLTLVQQSPRQPTKETKILRIQSSCQSSQSIRTRKHHKLQQDELQYL